MTHFNQIILALILLSPGTLLSVAQAADEAPILSEQDCAAILDDNGIAPKSVPANLVDSCRNIPLLAPAAGAAAATDPCSGADGAGSVYCWGIWDALAPAAGGGGDAPVIVYQEDVRPELSSLFAQAVANGPPDPPAPLPLVLDSCPPGSAGCGFASLVAGTTGSANPADTTIINFSIAPDGTGFVAAPGTAGEVQSAAMTTNFAPEGGDLYLLDSIGVVVNGSTTQISQLQARVVSPDGGATLIYGSDFWLNANVLGGGVDAQSGFFAAGSATTLADLTQLSNLNTSVNFAGLMSGDNGTAANITLNYGANSTWTGNWTGNYNFDAGGRVLGADFISDTAQFSNNVIAGYVQGATLGPAGNQAAVIAVDVELATIGIVRDVGMLLQTP